MNAARIAFGPHRTLQILMQYISRYLPATDLTNFPQESRGDHIYSEIPPAVVILSTYAAKVKSVIGERSAGILTTETCFRPSDVSWLRTNSREDDGVMSFAAIASI